MYNRQVKIFTIYFAIRYLILILCMAKKKQTGGRKPVEPKEKVILVGFYVKKYIIDNLGGMQATRDKAKAHIEFEGTKPF